MWAWGYTIKASETCPVLILHHTLPPKLHLLVHTPLICQADEPPPAQVTDLPGLSPTISPDANIQLVE